MITCQPPANLSLMNEKFRLVNFSVVIYLVKKLGSTCVGGRIRDDVCVDVATVNYIGKLVSLLKPLSVRGGNSFCKYCNKAPSLSLLLLLCLLWVINQTLTGYGIGNYDMQISISSVTHSTPRGVYVAVCQ